jgi:hypothetical protein
MRQLVSIPLWVIVALLVVSAVIPATIVVSAHDKELELSHASKPQSFRSALFPAALSPMAIRSAEVHWDYRIGLHPTGPTILLTVPDDRIFLLTDILLTPLVSPASDGNPFDFKIYEGTTLKMMIYTPSGQIHLKSGLAFAPGSQVIISQPYQGASTPLNVTFGITISGYDMVVILTQNYNIYLPSISQ